jgi:hypothetical protein
MLSGLVSWLESLKAWDELISAFSTIILSFVALFREEIRRALDHRRRSESFRLSCKLAGKNIRSYIQSLTYSQELFSDYVNQPQDNTVQLIRVRFSPNLNFIFRKFDDLISAKLALLIAEFEEHVRRLEECLSRNGGTLYYKIDQMGHNQTETLLHTGKNGASPGSVRIVMSYIDDCLESCKNLDKELSAVSRSGEFRLITGTTGQADKERKAG